MKGYMGGNQGRTEEADEELHEEVHAKFILEGGRGRIRRNGSLKRKGRLGIC